MAGASADRIVFLLTGRHIPTGDPQRCREAAQALNQAGADIGAVAQRLATMVGEVHAIGAGQGHEAFMDAAEHLAAFTGDLNLALGRLGENVNRLAEQIEATWAEIWRDVASIAVTIAFGFVTSGLADLIEAPLMAAMAARLAVVLSRYSSAVQGLAANIVARSVYYVADSAAWAVMDQTVDDAVLGAHDQPLNGLGNAGRSWASNVAFDGTFDGTEWGAKKVLNALVPGPLGRVANAMLDPSARAVRLLGRVGARETASNMYTVTSNLMSGADAQHVLPTGAQEAQKLAAHGFGRTGVDLLLGKGRGPHT